MNSNFVIKLVRLLLIIASTQLFLTCLSQSPANFAQSHNQGGEKDIPKLGKIMLAGSFDAIEEADGSAKQRLFLAIYYKIPRSNQGLAWDDVLIIFEVQDDKYKEMFRLDGEGEQWDHLIPLISPRLPGIALFSYDVEGNGPATVIAFTNGRFQVVHKGHDEGEFIDLNGDGIIEIFESSCSDDDDCKPEVTTIYVWDGNSFKKLMQAKWEDRFSKFVLNAVNRFNERKSSKREGKSPPSK